MNKKLNIICIIPARLASSRFPNKPMAKILEKPMILHVYERVKNSPILDECIVATCDNEIKACIENSGGSAVMTSIKHERASDRCAEALLKIEEQKKIKYDIVLMVQGDEPLINHNMIEESIKPFYDNENINVVNLYSKIKNDNEFKDRNCVKVLIDKQSFALYFSREPIPSLYREKHSFYFKQVCVIPFRRDFLIEYNNMQPTKLEEIESIDMLRILENGKKVFMSKTNYESKCVDTKEDLIAVNKILQNNKC